MNGIGLKSHDMGNLERYNLMMDQLSLEVLLALYQSSILRCLCIWVVLGELIK